MPIHLSLNKIIYLIFGFFFKVMMYRQNHFAHPRLKTKTTKIDGIKYMVNSKITFWYSLYQLIGCNSKSNNYSCDRSFTKPGSNSGKNYRIGHDDIKTVYKNLVLKMERIRTFQFGNIIVRLFMDIILTREKKLVNLKALTFGI